MTASHAACGYHLWLAPEGRALDRLQSVIKRLSRANDGPIFTPHVTLLSGLNGDELSLTKTNRRLATRHESFELDLLVPEAGTTYFQCIYMRVANSPSLSHIRQTAANDFALPAGDYMPHLSLYYGDDSAERRSTILTTIPAEAKCSFPIRSIKLIRADSDQPADWHCVDRASLGDQARSTISM